MYPTGFESRQRSRSTFAEKPSSGNHGYCRIVRAASRLPLRTRLIPGPESFWRIRDGFTGGASLPLQG
ncbi:hypothetical protein ANCCAN_08304 [Ancylostoma caninum]|uniref:Uncharacterized protein n=1 Tax=Ancylostoma caninum TaxID=29170 RepID=A0A368GRS3_ANCCA|nr:hypothetical protein ANCCAN_08304 [Ancylostoma caninum]